MKNTLNTQNKGQGRTNSSLVRLSLVFLLTLFLVGVVNAAIVSESPSGVSFNANTSDTNNFGYAINVSTSYGFHLISVTKSSYHTATMARLRYAGNTTDIAVAPFVGNVANFSAGTYLNSSTNYKIVTNANGSSYNLNYQSSGVTFSIAGTNLTWYSNIQFSATDQAGGLSSIEYAYQYPTPSGPSITLQNPTDGQVYLNGTNVVFSVTPISSINTTGLNVTLYTNKTGSWLPFLINASALNNTQTNFTLTATNFTSGGLYIWNTLVNDSTGPQIFATSNYSFSVRGVGFFQNEWTTQVIESSSTTIKVNFTLTSGLGLSSVNLTYNQTNYSGTFSTINSTSYQASVTLTTPSVTANTNMTFNWTAYLNDSTSVTSPNNQQTVLNFGLDNCSTNTIMIFNFTIQDERTQVNLTNTTDNTSIKLNINLYPNASLSVPILNFSKNYNQTHPARVCVSAALGSSVFYTNAQIEYDADAYEKEFYNIQNYSLNATSNPSQNVTLFDLLTSESTSYTITYKDSSFLPVSGALIQVQRKYIDEGIYKTVEIPMTDINGQAVAHLVTNDAIYTFTVVKNGKILATFTSQNAVCQNPAITDCTINLNSFLSSIDITDFEQALDFSYSIGYNSSTRIISTTFTIPSGAVSWITLNVTKADALSTSVCSTGATTSAGTLSCTIGSSFGNATVIVNIYKDGVLIAQATKKLDQAPSDIYGGTLVVLALFLIVTLVGASLSDNPIFTIIFFMIGVLLLFALNLVGNHGFGAGATILWLIVAVIIVIIKGGKRS